MTAAFDYRACTVFVHGREGAPERDPPEFMQHFHTALIRLGEQIVCRMVSWGDFSARIIGGKGCWIYPVQFLTVRNFMERVMGIPSHRAAGFEKNTPLLLSHSYGQVSPYGEACWASSLAGSTVAHSAAWVCPLMLKVNNLNGPSFLPRVNIADVAAEHTGLTLSLYVQRIFYINSSNIATNKCIWSKK